MILSDQIDVAISPAVTRNRLMDYLRDTSSVGATSEATEDQHGLHVRAGVALLSKQVVVQALDPVVSAQRTMIPIRWTATGVTGPLFPTLDANLELRPSDAGGTRIVLIGSYLPPLGALGAVVDRMILRQLATATVRNFLARIAVRVAHPATAADPVAEGRRALPDTS
jgi:hypothetical protein